ncbi:hypothetical protein SHLO109777_01580 [Shewanella loihica]
MLNIPLHRNLRISGHSFSSGGYSLVLFLFLLMGCGTPSQIDNSSNQSIALDTVSYNRYQAIYFCKQNRWAFCQSWGELSVTRLA